jgi:hypothetical protein
VPTKSDNDSTTTFDCTFASDARREELFKIGDLTGLAL